jgi:hypothetical protein
MRRSSSMIYWYIPNFTPTCLAIHCHHQGVVSPQMLLKQYLCCGCIWITVCSVSPAVEDATTVASLDSWHHRCIGRDLTGARYARNMVSGMWLKVHPLKTMWNCVSFQCSLIFEHCFAWRLAGFARLSFWQGIEMKINTGHWLNDTGTEKSVYSDRNLSQCHFACHIGPVRGWTRDFAEWRRSWSLKFIERIIKVQFLSQRDQTTLSLYAGSINAVLGNNWFIQKNPWEHAITLSAECTVFH